MAVSRINTAPEARSGHILTSWLSTHWFSCFVLIYGLWVLAPFLAPLLMQLGWTVPARGIYFIYSLFCHQLPERSLFFFGQKGMYSLAEIQSAWQNTADPLILRQFIGNQMMGWKVAWSDRMISFYTSFWLFALGWWPLRKKVTPVRWFVFALLLLPMVLDGGSHAISDLSGIGLGFRDTNQWLAELTGNVLPGSFYTGDMLGSFNSLARLVSGILAGLGLAWFVFPYMYRAQALNAELDKYRYGAVLEQFKK